MSGNVVAERDVLRVGLVTAGGWFLGGWLVQAGLLLILIGAMLIAVTALGSPRVIHSLLNPGNRTSVELEGR